MPDTPDTERLRAAIDAVHAPPELHARIAEQVSDAQRRRQHARGGRRRWSVAGAVTAAAVATAAVLAIVLPGGGGPTVAQVAQLGTAPPTQPAPAVHDRYSRWLDASVGGVWFPSWHDRRGWHATGTRTDTVDGRFAMTVYYAGPGHQRVTYAIVDGSPLPWPKGSRTARRGGTELRVVRGSGRTLVTWRERGHQCVIAAPSTVPASRLIALASWSAQRQSATAWVVGGRA